MTYEDFIEKLEKVYFGDRDAFNEVVEFINKLNNENQMLFTQMVKSIENMKNAINILKGNDDKKIKNAISILEGADDN